MKARLQGEILKIEKAGGGAIITFETKGKVDSANPAAKEATLNGTVFLKTLVVKDMTIGATLTITISDEEANERLD